MRADGRNPSDYGGGSQTPGPPTSIGVGTSFGVTNRASLGFAYGSSHIVASCQTRKSNFQTVPDYILRGLVNQMSWKLCVHELKCHRVLLR